MPCNRRVPYQQLSAVPRDRRLAPATHSRASSNCQIEDAGAARQKTGVRRPRHTPAGRAREIPPPCAAGNRSVCRLVRAFAASSRSSSVQSASATSSVAYSGLPPPGKKMPDQPFSAHSRPQPAAIPRKNSRPPRWASTPAPTPRSPATPPEGPPASPARRPASAPPPSSAGSGSSPRVPRSGHPPSPPGTRCPAPERRSAARSPVAVRSAPSRSAAGNPPQKAVDAAKYPLRRRLRMRHLHRQRPRLGDGLQEEPSRHPGTDAHLPRLEDDVRLALAGAHTRAAPGSAVSGTCFPRRSRTRSSASARKAPIVRCRARLEPGHPDFAPVPPAPRPIRRRDKNPRIIAVASFVRTSMPVDGADLERLHPRISPGSRRLHAHLLVVRRPLHIPLQARGSPRCTPVESPSPGRSAGSAPPPVPVAPSPPSWSA